MEKINISICIIREDIENLLVSAFEGGSNYWYMIQREIEPKEWTYFGDHNDKRTKYLHLKPLNPGGALMIDDSANNPDEHIKARRLDWDRIRKGLAVMATQYPKQFADILNEDADMNTADVFLQCCIFGDVIYG